MSTLGRYELLDILGGGGFATVYRAWDPLLGREVALKALLPHLAAVHDVRERFLAEARALATLKHPNIIGFYDVDEAASQPFFTMELVEGPTLAQFIAGSTGLALEQAADIIRALASAIDYLHGAGLVHRDIKASNVMLDKTGRVVLMDFGIVRALDQSARTMTGAALGTPEAMAPEQVRGEHPGPAADIYALGVLAYQLLAGRPPFQGDTARIVYAHVYEPPPPLNELRPGLPEGAYAAVAAALAKDPGGRPPSATVFADMLTGRIGVPAMTLEMPLPKWVPAAPPAKPPPPSQPPKPPRAARNWRPLIVGVGAIAVVVALAAGMTMLVIVRGASGERPKSASARTTTPAATATPHGRSSASSPTAVGTATPIPSAITPMDSNQPEAVEGTRRQGQEAPIVQPTPAPAVAVPAPSPAPTSRPSAALPEPFLKPGQSITFTPPKVVTADVGCGGKFSDVPRTEQVKAASTLKITGAVLDSAGVLWVSYVRSVPRVAGLDCTIQLGADGKDSTVIISEKRTRPLPDALIPSAGGSGASNQDINNIYGSEDVVGQWAFPTVDFTSLSITIIEYRIDLSHLYEIVLFSR